MVNRFDKPVKLVRSGGLVQLKKKPVKPDQSYLLFFSRKERKKKKKERKKEKIKEKKRKEKEKESPLGDLRGVISVSFQFTQIFFSFSFFFFP